MTFWEVMLEESEIVFRHLLNSVLLAIRYGLIVLVVTMAAGKGCKSFPFIKPKPAMEVSK